MWVMVGFLSPHHWPWCRRTRVCVCVCSNFRPLVDIILHINKRWKQPSQQSRAPDWGRSRRRENPDVVKGACWVWVCFYLHNTVFISTVHIMVEVKLKVIWQIPLFLFHKLRTELCVLFICFYWGQMQTFYCVNRIIVTQYSFIKRFSECTIHLQIFFKILMQCCWLL